MNIFLSELIGMALLITLGCGVVANVVLHKTKGNGSGWIVITMGWAMAVFVGVFASAESGSHLNPAVTIALAILHKISWADVPVYIAAQMVGAIVGAILVWLAYYHHFNATEDPSLQLAVFCTAPAIKNSVGNFITEAIATFVLLFAVLKLTAPESAIGALKALPVSFIVLGIGLSLGGPTGYAINPARDLGPRIAYTILPIKGKGSGNWGYSWVPVLGPIAGASLAAFLFSIL